MLLLVGFCAWSALQIGWDERPWETAVRQLFSGQDPYQLNLQERLRSDQQTGWPYGPIGLLTLEPIYAVLRWDGAGARPTAFVVACIVLATLAHALVVLEAWRLAGTPWRGATAGAMVLFNPFLLLLQSQGAVLDLAMLWLLLLCARAQEADRPRLSALALGASIGFKQLGLLYLPAWTWRNRGRPDALAVLAAAAVLPGLPFLVDNAAAFTFAYSGAANGYRNFVELDWWNVFGYALRHGVPAGWLRVLSWTATAGVMVAGTLAAHRARPLVVLAGVTTAAWLTYYSAYSLYLGWWTAIATTVVASS